MINAKKRLEVYRRNHYACVTCGRRSKLTVDHIIPLDKGGTDEMDNLQTMCHSCNLKKGNFYVKEWWKKWIPFTTRREANTLRNEMLGAMASRQGEMTEKIIVPKVQELLTEFKKEVMSIKIDERKLLGLSNSISAYARRSEERDEQLLKIIYLLADKVEELEKNNI